MQILNLVLFKSIRSVKFEEEAFVAFCIANVAGVAKAVAEILFHITISLRMV